MTQKKKPSTLLEKLAQSNHVQWMAWSKGIEKRITLPPELEKRWRKNWVTYGKLTEDVKDLHRVWAKRAMYLLKAYFRTEFIVKLNHSKFVEVMNKFDRLSKDDIEEMYEKLNERKGLFSAKQRGKK